MLDILRLVFDFAILMTLCTIHVSYYHIMDYLPSEKLVEWFRVRADNIAIIVVILTPAQLVFSGLQLFEQLNTYTVMSFVMIILMWFVTIVFTLQGYQKIMLGVSNAAKIPKRLRRINWIRITVYSMLSIWSFLYVAQELPFWGD